MTSYRHIPYDEFTEDQHCGKAELHEDHYWRIDGEPTPVIGDHPAERYCDGKTMRREGRPVTTPLAYLAWLFRRAGYLVRSYDMLAEVTAAQAVRAERERELLDLNGPCSNKTCRLHHAHVGPGDIRKPEAKR